MADVTFTDVITVEVLYSNFSDERIDALSPDHVFVTFRVSAPVFVWPEHHRRAPMTVLVPEPQPDSVFFLPSHDQDALQETLQEAVEAVSSSGHRQYEALLDRGVAREVARSVLPLSVMRTCVVSCDARSLIRFLSLPSSPVAEVCLVAEGYERFFAEEAPLTYQRWINENEKRNGRSAP